ncbi:MAG TPA: aminotransferase class IV, partial [Chloroflexota bacterium]|nr:aminotransferase class IV [Chloroflexota bacterium]
PAAVQPVTLAGTPVSRDDPFLFHKTTHRVTYEMHLAQQLATRPGLFDVLLWNQEGEVTEFTRGNVVLELDGTRWTPPRACGLLAGTFRAELLGRGELRERILTPDDVRGATHAWLINSVREWVPVQFVP